MVDLGTAQALGQEPSLQALVRISLNVYAFSVLLPMAYYFVYILGLE